MKALYCLNMSESNPPLTHHSTKNGLLIYTAAEACKNANSNAIKNE
jgi:hypothetical protein